MNEPLIALPYFSGNGHTRRLTQAVASGMKGTTACIIDVATLTDHDWESMDRAHAIVFCAPTYMGSTAADYAAFLEEAGGRWMSQSWQNKIAAGLTVATFPSGDKLATLMRMSIFAAQMGMIWVGQSEIGAPVFPEAPGINRDGSWLGLMVTSARDKSQLIDPTDLDTAERFGTRIAEATKRWS